MQFILDFIKKLLPKSLLRKVRPYGHGLLAYLAAIYYRRPSRSIIVIGVTGTAGKSTTVQMIAKILNSTGKKCGYTTTIDVFDGEKTEITPDSMSMPGRFRLQKSLRQMLNNGCKYAIVECTSEGLAQNRHLGIWFNVAILTILDQAHIEAHGGFENYRDAKANLFKYLVKLPQKSGLGMDKKIIGTCLDQQWVDYFLSFGADQKFGTTFEGQDQVRDRSAGKLKSSHEFNSVKIYRGADFSDSGESIEFSAEGVRFFLKFTGKFNAYNALLASACANMLGVPMADCAKALADLSVVAGRMEKIPNNKGVTAFLDYGAEPISMRNALAAMQNLPHRRIIHIFGSAGGHRDVRKRFEFGEITARMADVVIITNEDVYDSDPAKIAADIKEGIDRVPKEQRRASEVLIVLDRREAIKKGVEIARPEDILILTGKGIEQFLYLPGNKRIDWDDRRVLSEYLAGPSIITDKY